MFSNVPQFIDKEDKIVGPLTAKQLGWLAAGGVLLLLTWNMFDFGGFLVSSLVVGAVFGPLAFFRPYNQPLLSFLISSIMFAFNPKVYIWKRNYDSIKRVSTDTKKIKKGEPAPKKTLDAKKVYELSKILDNK